MFYRIPPLILILFWMSLTILAQETGDIQSEYQKKLSEIQDKNALDYFQLGKWAKEKKLSVPANLYFNKALEIKSDYPEAQESLSADTNGNTPNNYFEMVKECRKKLKEAGQKCADRWSTLAKYCKSKDLCEEKEFCLTEALKYDYNCKQARELRGEVKVEGFGWVTKSNAADIEKKTKKQVTDWVNALELKSEHYLLRTDVSFKKAQIILKDLETLYEAILDMFYGMEGLNVQSDKVFTVYFFRNKADYDAHASQCYPAAARGDSPGYFSPKDQIVHYWPMEEFYMSRGQTISASEQETRFHEATHQLLYLSCGVTIPKTNAPHFWVIEGIACYMGTMKNDKGKVSLGNHTQRTDIIKSNLNNCIPLVGFTQLTLRDFQGRQDAQFLYGQATALTLFFMQNEKYKTRFLQYIIAVHSLGAQGKLQESFTEFMKIDNPEQIEKEFTEFVKKKI